MTDSTFDDDARGTRDGWSAGRDDRRRAKRWQQRARIILACAEGKSNTRIRTLGFTPEVDLEIGIARYLDWIRAQADVRDYFAAAESILRSKGIVHQVQRGSAQTVP